MAGEAADGHVHVTVLDGFRPATEGSVTVVLEGAAGARERFSSTTVVRPGIFNVAIRPAAPGERDLVLEVEVDGVAEAVPGGRVRVGTPADPGGLLEQPHALPEVAGDEQVSFLLEQQWRTAFATDWATRGALRPSVSGTARVQPPSDGEVLVTAPVDGVVRAGRWPHTGQPVDSGAALVSLIPTAPSERSLAELAASVRELEARSSAAAARLKRLRPLLAKEAVSRREVEQAEAEATGLEARLGAARDALASSETGRTGRGDVPGLEITAPFSGRVAETLVTPGQRVDAGAPLLRVVRERPVWVRVELTPEDAGRLGGGLAGLILDTGGSAARPLDLGTVEAARSALAEQLELPSGYRLVLGGQFESAARSLAVIAVLSGVVLVAMYGVLFFAFSSHRQALIVLVNLPLAVVGGVVAVALGHGVLSAASLLGFITLFGIATRNGVLMVTRYQQLLEEGDTALREAVVQGSEVRMAPVMMTALTAGFALVPLVLAGGHPGNEILSPMGEVILGGLLSSTALNLVVVPALFARWGIAGAGQPGEGHRRA